MNKINKNALRRLLFFLASLALFFAPRIVFANDPRILPNPLKGDPESITKLLELILENIIIPVGAVIAVLAFIYTGFRYVLAQGRPAELEKVHKMFFGVVIGTLIILGSLVIVKAVDATIRPFLNTSLDSGIHLGIATGVSQEALLAQATPSSDQILFPSTDLNQPRPLEPDTLYPGGKYIDSGGSIESGGTIDCSGQEFDVVAGGDDAHRSQSTVEFDDCVTSAGGTVGAGGIIGGGGIISTVDPGRSSSQNVTNPRRVSDFSSFVGFLIAFIEILIPIIATLALLAFFWGAGKFILKAGDVKEIENGKKLLIWGLVALFVMASIWGILRFFQVDLFTVAFGIPLLPE